MRILVGITYYRPHTSGLTIYAERLAKALVRRGHQVTVLTSRYDAALAAEEVDEGVRIVRAPVVMRISKGVIMPTIGWLASRLVAENDVVHLHLPQFDAAGIALRGRLMGKPTVLTYHCDLIMPPGLLSITANQAVHLMNHLAARFTHKIVTYTRDYAENSPFLRHYLDKLNTILPPVELPQVSDAQTAQFAQENNPEKRHPVIGMAARFATEKGVEVLINAMPEVLKKFPNALVQFAGPYQNIIGEEQYYAKLSPMIDRYISSGNWRFLGVLSPDRMAQFYRNIDVLVLPSLNSTEAFGLVQIEAMMNSVPCIASNLPGVRQPVKMHEMGKIIPIGDAQELGNALNAVLSDKAAYQRDPEAIAHQYIPDQVAQAYEQLFHELLNH
jgi:glycosyltransferase involved in cell wall biosynthesis